MLTTEEEYKFFPDAVLINVLTVLRIANNNITRFDEDDVKERLDG